MLPLATGVPDAAPCMALEAVVLLLTEFLKIISPLASLVLIVMLAVPILITSPAIVLADCGCTINLGGGITCPLPDLSAPKAEESGTAVTEESKM